MGRSPVIAIVLAVQALCAVFFVSGIITTVLGIRTSPPSWRTHELIELGAAIGLIIGVLLGALALVRSRQAERRARDRLRAASGAFSELLADRFDSWGLTPAERDVALFVIKGFSTQEIATLRETSEGTVKSQTAAVFRKAGVNSRSRLLSLFIEDLIADPLTEADAPTKSVDSSAERA